jgi:hypothetical protein
MKQRAGEMHLVLWTIVGPEMQAHADARVSPLAEHDDLCMNFPFATLRGEHDRVVTPRQDLPLNEAIEEYPTTLDYAMKGVSFELLTAIRSTRLDDRGRPALDLRGGQSPDRNLAIDRLTQRRARTEGRIHDIRVNEPTIYMR